MKATKNQIQQHYMDAGMPEVYACMAAQEAREDFICGDAIATLWGSFIWADSKMGHAFWSSICEELYHASK